MLARATALAGQGGEVGTKAAELVGLMREHSVGVSFFDGGVGLCDGHWSRRGAHRLAIPGLEGEMDFEAMVRACRGSTDWVGMFGGDDAEAGGGGAEGAAASSTGTGGESASGKQPTR